MKKVLLIMAVLLIPVVCFGKARDEDEFRLYDDIDYNSIKISTVTVLPFKNTVGKQSSEEVQDLQSVLKEIFEVRGIKVIDATEELQKQRVDIVFDDISPEKLTAIGKALGADTVLSGTIYKFQTSKKGIATVGISGNLFYVPKETFIYKAKLAREKKINSAKKWVVGIYRGESKQNRYKALSDCASDMLAPVFDKLGIKPPPETETK
ncbi:MAG TPA: hypothetical protein PLQ76_05370 [bacterium]|nr:hypothetical protein [bacterium]